MEKRCVRESYVKPNRSVTPATVASCFTDNVMKDAGINVAVYKAHSITGASLGKAYSMVPLCRMF